MGDAAIAVQINDFEAKYERLQTQVRDLVAENDALRAQVRKAQSAPEANANTTNNDAVSNQLIETESFLAQERQQVVRVTHQAAGFQRQNEQLRRYVQQAQQQLQQQRNQTQAQIEKLTTALREAKTAESERTMELEEARGRVDQLEKVLRTKDSILQRTKDERDEINIRNEERTNEVETRKLDLLTQHEQNAALKNQVKLLTGQFTSAEARMMELNAALVASNGKRDEMAQRLRELEETVKGTLGLNKL